MNMREQMALMMYAKDLEQTVAMLKTGAPPAVPSGPQDYMGFVDAALDALTRPTAGMIEAAYDEEAVGDDGESIPVVPERYWIGMILAAKDGK